MRTWIEKQRYIIDFTLSSLLRRKVKNFGLLALYTLIVFVLASVMFFTHAIKKEAALVLKASPEMIVHKLSAGRQDLVPLRYAEAVRRIRGVRAVEGRLWGYYFDPQFGANYTLVVPAASKASGQPSSRVVTTEDEHQEPAVPIFRLAPRDSLGVGSLIIGSPYRPIGYGSQNGCSRNTQKKP